MADPKYQAFTIELTYRTGIWYATVTRLEDHETRFYYDASVGVLLDADIAGFIGGYDD